MQGGKLDLPVAVALEKQGGDLVFSPRGTARQGVVRRGGEAVHTLRWSGEGRSTTCTVGPPPAPWTLAVRVDDPRDGAPLQLMGCGLPGVYEGGVVRVERPPGSSCVVQARRRDGVLVAESEAVELAPLDGEHVDLVLHVPAVDVGGIGAMVRSDPDGVVLTDVPPGTPAALAGLREGDLVVGADGQPLSGLRLPEQIARVTGPVGETVRLQVIRGGRVVELEVERSWVEPEDLDLE
ncbi:MAG: PDZ domain-containing protein [Alphaproteobacteria bacterium]|nr:PDZ domain-containing protein [Alphaproteobacteria bacterium]